MSIAFDRFVEVKRGRSVDLCHVPIQHDAHTPDRGDHCVDLLDCDGGDFVFFSTGEKGYSKFFG
jgi:hypothetical protein